MSDSTERIEVPPLVLFVSKEHVTFRFLSEMLAPGSEHPPNFEGMLKGAVAARPGLLEGREVIIDLENRPAISSKQLGAMLAVRQTCKPTEKLRVINLRPNVRELLHVTKLEDFFHG